MLLLAVDTSAGLGVAVHDGRRVLAVRTDPDPRHHAELLAPAIRDVLVDAGADRRDLTAIAVGVGPAPFTGLRVGVVTALVLGEALRIGVHGVCSLDAIALTAVTAADPAVAGALAGGFLVAADAKRGEVHWARYTHGGRDDHGAARPVRVEGPAVCGPGAVERRGLPAVGAGARRYRRDLAGPDAALDTLDPGALAVLAVEQLGRGEPLLAPAPLYLRRPDAKVP